MSGSTSLLKLIKPTVSGDADVWGGYLNTNFDSIDKLQNVVTTTGSANAYVLTSGQTLTAYATGQRFRCKLNFTCTGSSTLNVDSLGAKTIKKRDAATNVSSGDLVSGQVYTFTYDSTNFVLETYVPSDVQPLDATLTALAALSWSSGNALVQFTAADTVSLTLTPSVTSITVSGIVSAPDGSAAAPSIKVGDEQNGLYSGAANAISIAAGGALKLTISTALALNVSGIPLYASNGTVSAPSLAFGSDSDNGAYYISTNNWALATGGAQTIAFSTTAATMGAGIDFVLPTTIIGPTAITSAGYRGTPITTKDSNYTTVLADAATTLYHTSASTHTWTIDSNANVAYPVGTILCFENESGGGNVTIAITSDTLRWGSSTGSRTLAANGSATAKKMTSTSWRLTGTGIT